LFDYRKNYESLFCKLSFQLYASWFFKFGEMIIFLILVLIISFVRNEVTMNQPILFYKSNKKRSKKMMTNTFLKAKIL
jgi:hypothetical protein